MRKLKTLALTALTDGILKDNAFKKANRKSPKDFTRERKLSFVCYFYFLFNLNTKSLPIELDNFFDAAGLKGRISKQAFSKGRQKIKWEGFRHIYESAVDFIFEEDDEPINLYKGYRVTAIDGTEIFLEPTKQMVEEFGQKPSRDNCKAKVSIMCDIQQGLIVECGIGRYDFGERRFAMEHLEKYARLKSDKELVIFDRGYPSAELVDFLEEKGYKYLMRVKKKFNAQIDETDKKDFYIDLEHGGRPRKVRVIKLVLPGGEIEVLITNLARNKFKNTEFQELYFMRWPVETKYDTLKNKLEIESFTGRTPLAVKQEFYATMYLANLLAVAKAETDAMIAEADAGKGNKYEYATNESVMISKFKDKLILCFLIEDDQQRSNFFNQLTADIIRHKTPIRPNRTFERKTKVKASVKRRAKRPL